MEDPPKTIQLSPHLFSVFQLRVSLHLWTWRYAELLRTQIVDSVTFLHSEVSLGSKVLVEGANAALLDIDFGSSAERDIKTLPSGND